MKPFEANIIGCLLIDDDEYAIGQISDKLSAEMFETEIASKIFLEYQKAYENHEKVDYLTVKQRLVEDGYDGVVVDAEMQQASAGEATSIYINTYAESLKKRYKTIQLHDIIGKINYKPTQIDEEISSLLLKIESLMGDETTNNQTLPDIVAKYKDTYFTEKPPKMMLGFDRLDSMINGFEQGNLIIIGARPSVGKSAFVTQFVCRIGRKGKKIGFYNLEMSDKEVYERFIVNESGIKLSYLKNAESCTIGEKKRFDEANERLLKQIGVRIISDGAKTVGEIRSESRHMGYDLIVIDYLQLLMPGHTYKGNRQAEVGEISRSLKALAKELKIPIIALSQLNRLSEGKETKEPTMSELREAGNIEQDADKIILLWNLDADDQEHKRKGCKVDKNRQGRLGKVILNFDGDMMKFEETNEKFEEKEVKKKTPFDENKYVETEDSPFT